MLPMPGKPQPPPQSGDERAMLTTFLDFQRDVLLRKVGGLDDDGLRRVMTPSGLTLLGLLKHIAYVERYWFRSIFAGEDVTFPWTDADPDADWRPEPGETAERIATLYRDEVARAREITSRASLDESSASPASDETFRWILFHMLEEYARHLGHADLMREFVDGRTGFSG